MSYANPASAVARRVFAAFSGFRIKRLDIDEMPDHLRRDLGLADGGARSRDVARGDGRAHRPEMHFPHAS
ncbi:hypothetical protein [Mesorhizobium marinum]|uniref:DUF1127 domain-containing protein n=1 Tax=Mesorhizobium marinum TaxID=3228790 RepID=A0ABV3R320_9HYPH